VAGVDAALEVDLVAADPPLVVVDAGHAVVEVGGGLAVDDQAIHD